MKKRSSNLDALHCWNLNFYICKDGWRFWWMNDGGVLLFALVWRLGDVVLVKSLDLIIADDQ